MLILNNVCRKLSFDPSHRASENLLKYKIRPIVDKRNTRHQLSSIMHISEDHYLLILGVTFHHQHSSLIQDNIIFFKKLKKARNSLLKLKLIGGEKTNDFNKKNVFR